jgi:uncharacterized membrane protein
MSVGPFSIKEAFSFGWQKTKEHFWFFLASLLAFGIVFTVINMFVERDGADSIAAQFLLYIVNALMGLGLINAVLAVCEGKVPGSSSFKTDLISFLKFLVTQLVFSVMVFVGFLLLIIPGVIIMLRFFYTPYILLDKKGGIGESFKESWRITKGSSWELLILFLVTVGINIAGAIALGVGLFVTIPLTMIATGFVYKKLSGASLPSTDVVQPPLV